MRIFELGKVFLARRGSAGRRDTAWPACASRLCSAAWPAGRPCRLQWGVAERAVDFFDVKGDIEALLAPRTARFVPARAPGLASRPFGRALEVDGVSIGVVGELHPRWRQSYELPTAPIVFELDAQALQQRVVARLPSRCPLPAMGLHDVAGHRWGEQVTQLTLIDARQSLSPR